MSKEDMALPSDRAGGPSDLSRCASQPEALIPSAKWHFDPVSYAIGDPIYVQISAGWNTYRARRYIVKKVTPTGIIVAEDGASRIRINKRGRIGNNYRESVISAERAAELRREQRVRAAWQKVRVAGEAIEKGAAKANEEALNAALTELASAIEARRAETHGGSVHESAAPKADAQEPNPNTAPGTGG